MTYQSNYTLPTELLEKLAAEGLDFIPELIRILVNAAMDVERQKHLGLKHMSDPVSAADMPMATSPKPS